jgi:hypothetical protein
VRPSPNEKPVRRTTNERTRAVAGSQRDGRFADRGTLDGRRGSKCCKRRRSAQVATGRRNALENLPPSRLNSKADGNQNRPPCCLCGSSQLSAINRQKNPTTVGGTPPPSRLVESSGWGEIPAKSLGLKGLQLRSLRTNDFGGDRVSGPSLRSGFRQRARRLDVAPGRSAKRLMLSKTAENGFGAVSEPVSRTNSPLNCTNQMVIFAHDGLAGCDGGHR